MSCIREQKISKLNLTDIQKETLKEKIFRTFAVFMIILFPLAFLMCFRVVKQYKRAIILRFGRVRSDSPAGPGVIWVVPCTDSVLQVDLRTQSLILSPQEILTKDSVTVTVDAIIYYHVLKPLNCVLNVQSHRFSTEMIAIATLRNILGQQTLTDVLTNRENISRLAKKEMEKVTHEWGVSMERVEIKNVLLPFELQKAMAAEAEGTRLAKAKIIEAEGEIKAAENLKQASRIMMENPEVMLLRYLQTLNFIASQQTTSIFFPFPLDIPEPHGCVKDPRSPIPESKRLEISMQPSNSQPNEDKTGTSHDDPGQSTTNPEFSGFNINPDSSKKKIPEENLGSPHDIDDRAILDLESYLGSQTSKESILIRLQTENKGGDKCIEKFLIFMSYIIVIICFPLSLFCVFVAVRQFERAVILRNGKVYKNKAFGPGLIHFLPCVDIVKFTDLRIICYAVPAQEALTKDSLTVSVDAVVYYKICDPVWAVINVANYKMSTQFLAATTLRNAIGTKKLSEILKDRPAISFLVAQHMKHFAREWGIKIVRVEIKDICLPLQLQKAMAAEAESSRLANAKIIVAKAEIESTKNLQKATTMLMDNPLCMQLRYLQSLHMIAGDKTHTIVFPFSIDSIKKMFK